MIHSPTLYPPVLRLATLADAPFITDFNARLAEESEGLRLDRVRLRAGVEAVLTDATKGLYWVAEAEGVPVGQLMITWEWSDWRNGFFWWIQSVYVRADWRGRGVCTSLYDFVRDQASRREDVCGLRLYVENHNERAKRSYERLGLGRTAYDMYEVDFRKGG